MQHVIRHWQGSLTEADSTAAMQMDADFTQSADGAATPRMLRTPTREFTDAGERRLSCTVVSMCCGVVLCCVVLC